MIDITRRIDCILLLELNMSNPNGDPDNDNCPRTIERDGHTHVVISDSSIKRKLRDFAKLFHGVKLYVDHGGTLSEIQAGYDTIEDLTSVFWDSRALGGTHTKYGNKGRLCSPLNIPHAVSLFPVQELTMALTRVAGEKQDETKVKASQAKRAKQSVDEFEQTEGDKERADKALRANMGSRTVIQHALVPIYISFSPHLARVTGMTAKDLEIALDALIGCWEHSKSSSRSDLRFRRLVMFQHSNARGNTHAFKLHERLEVTLKDQNVETPSSFADYDIKLNLNNLPEGITVKDFGDDTTGFTADMAA